jgi:nucleotide-binding universal stress UspA family protein
MAKATAGRPILLATDFSAASEPAIRKALETARAEGRALLVAHVLEMPLPLSPDGYVLPRVYDDLGAAVRSDAERKLRAVLDRAREAGVRARGLLLRGAPHDAIARAARSHRADRIVVGTHGRRGFSRFLLGSVAARVVTVAPCSVLVVPAARSARRSS